MCSKPALGTAVRRPVGVAMVLRCLKRVAMRMYLGGLRNSIDAGILGLVSVVGQCLQVWSAEVDVVVDPGEKIGDVG
jgi:hypothetical protein